MSLQIILLTVFSVIFKEISGHGMMLEPPNRSSLWRYDSSAVTNYDDNANYCGGAYVQHNQNNGQCGLCGDSYTDAHPQNNENTGKYGSGKIVRTYEAGSVIDIDIYLVANHRGSFTFSLCEIQNSNAPESGEDCFEAVPLADGSTQYNVSTGEKEVSLQLRLPAGKTCAHCSLRWNYRAGNNWGQCEDGSQGQGCGAQETFRNCADIAVV